jgi:hypothetical protein
MRSAVDSSLRLLALCVWQACDWQLLLTLLLQLVVVVVLLLLLTLLLQLAPCAVTCSNSQDASSWSRLARSAAAARVNGGERWWRRRQDWVPASPRLAAPRAKHTAAADTASAHSPHSPHSPRTRTRTRAPASVMCRA